jgi:hypothetical protein
VLSAPLVESKPPIMKYAGSGSCVEEEESDLPGTAGRVSYPCVVNVKLTVNTSKSTIVGVYTVKEESTQP